MPGISRLIVVGADERIIAGLRFGFERAGITVESTSEAGDMAGLLRQGAPDGEHGSQVIIAGPGGDATAVLASLQKTLRACGLHLPIIWLGNDGSWREATLAGAGACLPEPARVRDVLTMARLLASGARQSTSVFRGEITEYGGVFYLLRALVAGRTSGVLSLVRGLRQGELRFCEGEVTSAQMGMLHGMAALHQLLIWAAASFELCKEDVVRRNQIPLAPADLVVEARRFLDEVREVGGGVECSALYESVSGKTDPDGLPDEVRGVLELMDGRRTVADVIEDSPFRLFETLRIVGRLAKLGMIRRIEASSRPGAHLAISLREWMIAARLSVGSRLNYARNSDSGAGAGGLPSLAGLGIAGAAAAGAGENGKVDDWSELVLTGVSSEGRLSQIVPAAKTAGEILIGGSAALAHEASCSADEQTTGKIRIVVEVCNEEPETTSSEADSSASAVSGRAKVMQEVKPAVPENDAATAESMPLQGADALVVAQRPPGGDTAIAADIGDSRPERGSPSPATTPSDEQPALATSSSNPAAGAETRRPLASTNPPGQGAFTEDEEEFFRKGVHLAESQPPVESFDDLDRGYRPQGFWQRLFGGRRTQHPRPPSGPAAMAASVLPRQLASAGSAEAARPPETTALATGESGKAATTGTSGGNGDAGKPSVAENPAREESGKAEARKPARRGERSKKRKGKGRR